MPTSKGNGGRNRNRRKKKADDANAKRELVSRGCGQEYAQVVFVIGNDCEVVFIDGPPRRVIHIRPKLQKKISIGVGDLILVGFQDYKAEVILKYTPDEARLLKAYGELPEDLELNEGIVGGLDDEQDGAGAR